MLPCKHAFLVTLLMLLMSNYGFEVSGDVQTCENCTDCAYPCHRDIPPTSSGEYPMYGAPPPPPPAQPSGAYPGYGAPPPPPNQSGQSKCPPSPPCFGCTPPGGYGYGNAPPYSYTPPSPYTYVPYAANTASSPLPAAITVLLLIISYLLPLF